MKEYYNDIILRNMNNRIVCMMIIDYYFLPIFYLKLRKEIDYR